MSTTETRRPSDDCPTAAVPVPVPAAAVPVVPVPVVPVPAAVPAVPVRRSILRPALPAPRDEGAPFADWRGQAPTEELAAVPAPSRRSRRARRSACRHGVARRHLRPALIGTLLAVVAVTGLSAYAAAGVTDARQAAPDPARSHVSPLR